MKSIFSRLIISFIVTILIAIFSIGVLFSGLLENYLTEQKEIELKSKGNRIVELSRDYLNHNIDEGTFAYVLNSIDAVVDSRTLIVDKSGNFLNFSYRPKGYNIPPLPLLKRATIFDDSDIAQILRGSTVSKSGYSIFFNEPMITVGIPIYNTDYIPTIIGAIVLSSPVTGVNEILNKATALLVFASLAALAFSLITAFFISRTLSRPIHTISKAARDVAEGNYSQKLSISRKDEIGSLASSFNYLTEKLKDTIGDLNNEKSKLSDILYSMEEGLIALDLSLNIIHINPAALHLLDIKKSSPVLKDDIYGGDIFKNASDVLQNGKSITYEKETSEGRIVSIIMSPLKYKDGHIYGVIILLQDISESVKLEKMRRDFVANVSHELRTPLTSIRGFIEPLIDGTVEDDKTILKYHTIIRSETLRLEKLINDLLDLSRFQAGKVVLDIQRVDITELISNVSAKFKPQFDSKEIKFAFNKPKDSLFVSADGDRLEQLIIIFIDNAIKFTERYGKIEISLFEEGDAVRISIEDSGLGIPKEDIPYIWDRFYKVDKSRTNKNSGTGLGLSIAKNIIELHGQHIWVESEQNKGTRFEFTMKKEA
ncbi:sensor histidine kinase YycG [Oxobacter pfennigii]|uniref:histidine kinase n=1 Tax=Oxobacter pfennigii TaxID=36849 RepID=A0A0P8YVL7_9CLOT|nr:ATP-binding protein [Oxobacter pfennigii]KPU43740.1 sensor histidine kinase YycG [Oxobacter pfennigii]